tara:strand:+ start:735 stop:1556 length:822 start_codon:yes stop_codon:yes gene_type:complete
VKALSHSEYRAAGDISTTSLILPPQIRQLKARHNGAITEDVSDKIWMFLGNFHHRIMELAEVPNAIKEKRLSHRVNGWEVTGTADLYEPPATLSDYKVTSTWTIVYGLKPEWEQQLNIYKWLFEKSGLTVNKLQIVAILRDWSKLRATREHEYPQKAVQVLSVPIWTPEDAQDFVETRVAMHQAAEMMLDDQLPFCTPKERWAKATTYAVKKNKNRKASNVYADPLKAGQRIKQLNTKDNKNKYWLEERPGESTRCEHYCSVKAFCHQYKPFI